ncbi:MAG: hypothetical protein ACI9BF_000650 [Candidatus Paceibacteria bacterium]|jgi:uncharacterized protein (DUF1330 family)
METENKCTVIIEATLNEGGMGIPEFKEYSEKATALGAEYGAIPVSKHMIGENLGQGEAPHVVSIVEFPSKEKATEMMCSEEYKSLFPLREAAFKEVKILITK